MDGVLVDACDLHKISLELAMQEELGYKISDEDHYNKFNGLPTRKKLQILGLSKEKIEIINDKKQKYMLELIEKHIHKDQQKIELLHYLKKSGYLLACVTNSVEKTTHIMLKKTGIFD
jgi:beta-phosphoglucomutase-like phosphatase (HAD superfamily)